jgi:phosphoribosylamine---glycine ligase
MMRVLVVGRGAREHALVQAISQSQTETQIFSFPGSDAIGDLARRVEASGLAELGDFLKRQRIDLCVAGEESYLVKDEGLAEVCRKAGVPCWGPSKAAAQLEASKGFAKEFLVRHWIPTADYSLVSTIEEARRVIRSYPVVLKYDGLAAGKGVAICPDAQVAEDFLGAVLSQRKFGEGKLVVEEFLQGPEISIFAAVSGEQYQIFAPARDYKRIGDGDQGPNTGGMGAVSCRLGMLDSELAVRIEETIVQPTIRGLMADGLPYVGFLYFGLMLTPQGPKVLEYNCRFGDPEAQAVFPLLSGDLAQYLLRAASGGIETGLIRFSDEWSVCVVLAAPGYPDSPQTGAVITGLNQVQGARVYHAGTRKRPTGEFETNGGRVLSVVAKAARREDAVAQVYQEAAKIQFEGRQMRRDIGTRHFT